MPQQHVDLAVIALRNDADSVAGLVVEQGDWLARAQVHATLAVATAVLAAADLR